MIMKSLRFIIIFLVLTLFLVFSPACAKEEPAIEELAVEEKLEEQAEELIEETTDNETLRPIRILRTEKSYYQSGIFIDKNDELVFDILKSFHLAFFFNPSIKNSLALGGATYAFPLDYLKKYPRAKIDVVEIDPQITQAAQKYFNLKEDSRLNIYHQDGRFFINTTKNKYDAIFVDAFKTRFTPTQLTTLEFIEKSYQTLNKNGVILVNIVSSLEKKGSKFLEAEYLTYKKIFPQVYLFALGTKNKNQIQNILLVAIKSDKKIELKGDDKKFSEYLSKNIEIHPAKNTPILTDDFSPTDQYLADL